MLLALLGLSLLLGCSCAPRYTHLYTRPAGDWADLERGDQLILQTRSGALLQGQLVQLDSSDSTLVLRLDQRRPAYISYYKRMPRRPADRPQGAPALADTLEQTVAWGDLHWIRTTGPYDPHDRWEHPLKPWAWGAVGFVIGGVLVGGGAALLLFIF